MSIYVYICYVCIYVYIQVYLCISYTKHLVEFVVQQNQFQQVSNVHGHRVVTLVHSSVELYTGEMRAPGYARHVQDLYRNALKYIYLWMTTHIHMACPRAKCAFGVQWCSCSLCNNNAKTIYALERASRTRLLSYIPQTPVDTTPSANGQTQIGRCSIRKHIPPLTHTQLRHHTPSHTHNCPTTCLPSHTHNYAPYTSSDTHTAKPPHTYATTHPLIHTTTPPYSSPDTHTQLRAA